MTIDFGVVFFLSVNGYISGMVQTSFYFIEVISPKTDGSGPTAKADFIAELRINVLFINLSEKNVFDSIHLVL